jgi:hypothetical protein
MARLSYSATRSRFQGPTPLLPAHCRACPKITTLASRTTRPPSTNISGTYFSTIKPVLSSRTTTSSSLPCSPRDVLPFLLAHAAMGEVFSSLFEGGTSNVYFCLQELVGGRLGMNIIEDLLLYLRLWPPTCRRNCCVSKRSNRPCGHCRHMSVQIPCSHFLVSTRRALL